MEIVDIMKRLGDTDGREGWTWDPRLLKEAAERCASGKPSNAFDDLDDLAEAARFDLVWREIQAELED